MCCEHLIPLATSDSLADQTTLALACLNRHDSPALPLYLGTATLNVKVGHGNGLSRLDQAIFPNTFTIHKELLCLRSRHFNARFQRPFGSEALGEALIEIENGAGTKEFFTGREGNPLLELPGVPAGYIPSWMSFLEQYRREAQNLSEDTLDTVPELETSIELPDDHLRIFNLFVHWLYTGQLLTKGVKLSEQYTYAALYSLAERLDVPDLRHQCYSGFREIYQSGSDLPDDEILAIVVNNCSSKCALRIYLVQLFAHAVITKSTTDIDNGHLDMYPLFYNEVAREITQRLLTHEESRHPYEIETLDSDDSDYEVETESITPTSENDSDFELDHMLELSDDEDVDSPSVREESQERLLIETQNNQTTESVQSNAVNSDAPTALTSDDAESMADEAESSTAENDDRGSVASDQEASTTSEESAESETTNNEDFSDVSEPENSVKTEDVEFASTNVSELHNGTTSRSKKRSNQRSQGAKAALGTSYTVDGKRTIDGATPKKRKRLTPAEGEGADKENPKKKKYKDLVTIVDLLD